MIAAFRDSSVAHQFFRSGYDILKVTRKLLKDVHIQVRIAFWVIEIWDRNLVKDLNPILRLGQAPGMYEMLHGLYTSPRKEGEKL